MTDLQSPPARSRTGRGLGAVILTGGTATRMGGADKASIELGGRTLLERALAATASAADVVVVGEPVPTSRQVTWAREDPPGGGPAAALLAGVAACTLPPERVSVLGVDMAEVTSATVERLVLACPEGVDGAVLVDGDGR